MIIYIMRVQMSFQNNIEMTLHQMHDTSLQSQRFHSHPRALSPSKISRPAVVSPPCPKQQPQPVNARSKHRETGHGLLFALHIFSSDTQL